MSAAAGAGPLRRRIASVLRSVFSNPDLRRLQLAYAGFNAAEWGVWIAMLVYAYDRGGAGAAGLVAVIQLVPAALFAPFAARLADRHPPARVLTLGYAGQAAAMGATAAALLLDAPLAVVYALAAVATCSVTITRPAQAALVPALVRGVDELTATNVVANWIESVSVLAAPALSGLLIALSGPGLVFAVMGGTLLVAAALAAPLTGPPGAAGAEVEGHEQSSAFADAAAGIEEVTRHPQTRVLASVLGAQFVLIGALDVLFVVLAVDVLDLGGSGAGYLNAAFGAGGVIGIAWTVVLVGRARLAPPLLVASAAWTLALLALGLWQTAAGAFVLLAVAGAARAMLDVGARTLLQRTAPADLLARVFGVLEVLDAVGLALGSVLAAVLVSLLGPEAATVGLSVVLPLLLALAGRRLRTIDAHADVPVVEVALLRSIPIFSSLGAAELEGLARRLSPLDVAQGESVIREGQRGERYYVIADGELEVTQSSVPINLVRRGDGIGEISLLASVPCTATVTALTPARLLAMDGASFMEVVHEHPRSDGVAQRVMRERLANTAQPSQSAST